MNYPPHHLYAKQNFTIAQISDLHLTGEVGVSASYQNFLKVLELAIAQAPNLLLLTGDLVNDGTVAGYDWLFDVLHNTNISFACIAGNHDVTHELGAELPFDKRQFLPIMPDKRLLSQHTITIHLDGQLWQIVLLHSPIAGQIAGQLSQSTLAWLKHTLANHIPSIIAMHHHPISVGSAWIDAYQLQNDTEFWRIIDQYPNVHSVLCGHVHQVHTIKAPTRHICTVHTCLSTDRQFMPYHDSFMLDNQQGGLRILQLNNSNTLTTYTKRYDSHLTQ